MTSLSRGQVSRQIEAIHQRFSHWASEFTVRNVHPCAGQHGLHRKTVWVPTSVSAAMTAADDSVMCAQPTRPGGYRAWPAYTTCKQIASKLANVSKALKRKLPINTLDMAMLTNAARPGQSHKRPEKQT